MARSFYVNFKVPELKEALSNIGKYDVKTAVEIEQAVSESTKAIGKGARSRVPVRSGNLKKKIRTSFNVKKVEGTIAAKSSYAHLPEFGAGTATVKPGPGKKALTIGGMSYGPLMPGQKHFAASAKIPARKKQPYMQPSYEAEVPTLIRRVTQAVKKQ
ncbi:HK97 gp10 family phage protein [Sporomusa malonica]|uniref:Bacteriophage HK97-gp10, putative tail-component n=1 Tax=Sporomusa malonica TaxID=112901 RepID=A0A1W2AR62_9FIRM|nr:HK97 gp10 family phage protein [Sporomusa malonica]SMC63239.1 Bacteriophage HK97-gp10, putative tail-component [Sporomusa malonica]